MKTILSVVMFFYYFVASLFIKNKPSYMIGDIPIYINDFRTRLFTKDWLSTTPHGVAMKNPKGIFVTRDFEKVSYFQQLTIASCCYKYLLVPDRYYLNLNQYKLRTQIELGYLPEFIKDGDIFASEVVGKYNVIETLYFLKKCSSDYNYIREIELRLDHIRDCPIDDTMHRKNLKLRKLYH